MIFQWYLHNGRVHNSLVLLSDQFWMLDSAHPLCFICKDDSTLLHMFFSTCSFIIRLRGSGKLVRIDRNMRLMIHNRVYSGVCPCCFQNLFHASQRSTDPLHLLPSSPMLVVSHGFPYQNAETLFPLPKARRCVSWERCPPHSVRAGATLRSDVERQKRPERTGRGEDVRVSLGEHQIIEAFQMYYKSNILGPIGIRTSCEKHKS